MSYLLGIAQLDGWADIPVCIYPTGTINLIAREAGYGRNIAGFVKRISSAQPPRQHYVGRITNKPFLACASVGPDSLSVAAVSADLKRRIGRFAYVVSLARLLWDWPRMRLSVSANGHIHRCEAAFVLKGHYFAGPWTLAPEADLRKPDFQLLLLGKARRRGLFAADIVCDDWCCF
jgi:diacylglycerol kinase (ATP)